MSNNKFSQKQKVIAFFVSVLALSFLANYFKKMKNIKQLTLRMLAITIFFVAGISFSNVASADTTSPTVTVTCPSDGQIYRNPTASVSGTALDNVAVSSVEVSVNGGVWLPATGTGYWERSGLSLNPLPASNTIDVRAIDTATPGNISAIISITVTHDPTTPTTSGLSFKRTITINEWSGTLSSEDNVKKAIDESDYMNNDAVLMIVYSDYFEAVRDPVNRGSWDTRASWDMVGRAIEYAHSKNIQFHVWIPANYVNSPLRAEDRIFGDQFRVKYRDGSVNSLRNDLAFTELKNYEIGLLSFIAQNYPNLDGIHLEEPYYQGKSFSNYASYTTAMRERIKDKYGYDPMNKPESEMIPIIHNEMRIVLTDFFLEARNAVKAANPNLQFSANGPYYSYRGLSLDDVNDQHLFDWYSAQIYRETVADYIIGVEALSNNLPDISIVSFAGITYSVIYPASNEAFLDQMKITCQYGGDAEGTFTHFHRNRVVDGQTAYEGLHNLLPSSLCTGISSDPVCTILVPANCGDGTCDPITESCTNCPADCGVCPPTTIPPPLPPDEIAPSVPMNLKAHGSILLPKISLEWRPSSDNRAVTGYKIFRDGVEIATTSSTYYNDTDVSYNILYTYTVSAFDAVPNESAKSAPASAMSAPLNVEFKKQIPASNFTELIGNTLSWVLSIAGSLALLIIIGGGVMYIGSTGDEQRTTKAKRTVVWAIGGLILILIAYSAVSILEKILS